MPVVSVGVGVGVSVVSVGVGVGVCQITAEFDADMTEGVRTIRASAAVEVVAAEAQTAEIVFSDEVPQPEGELELQRPLR